MSRGAIVRPAGTDDTRLAQARERFLTAEPIEPGQVRDTILASWWRSREWHVAADRIDLSYVRDPDLDTPLTRNALPVLHNLRESLEGQPISVILTDAHGVALSRLTADHDLERHLDSLQLAPGFSYAEEFVGTNGIGTALDAVQVPLKIVVGGQPGQRHAMRVGEDDADRLALQALPQAVQHRQGIAGQRSVEVGVADIGQVDTVGRDMPFPGAPPGRQDQAPYLARPDGLRRQEPLPGLSQPGIIPHPPPDDRAA